MPIYKVPGRKDGKQKYRVRLNYNDNYGRAKQITRIAYGSEEAKQLERELAYKIKEEKPAQKLTLSNLKDEYLNVLRHEIRESTLDKKDRNLKRYILTDEFKNLKIDKLTVPILQSWKNGINETTLSITTKQNIYKEFRALLNFAVKMEYLPQNPLIKIGNFKAPLEQKKEMLFYTPEEFREYISAALEIAKEDQQKGSYFGFNAYTFFMIAFFTGMRKGEIHALTWEDIDLDKRIIHVKKSLNQKTRGSDLITAPKNASSIRDIEIPTPLLSALKEQLSRCHSIKGFSKKWFACGGVQALRDTSLEKANRAIAQRAGVKHIRIHDFRHSHASLLANEGINIQEVARRLGHSDIKMTWNKYSHLYPRESERALEVLNGITI